VRTLRDGSWYYVPLLLLVEGDIVNTLSASKFSVALQLTPHEHNLSLVANDYLPSFLKQLPENSKETIPIMSLLLLSFLLFIRQSVAVCVYLLLSDVCWHEASRILGNVRLVLLAERLQSNQTPYSETDDLDEFDEEAPPPTKNIILSPFETLLTLYRSVRLNNFKFLRTISWRHDLVSELGRVSVLAFLDREGPLAMVIYAAPKRII